MSEVGVCNTGVLVFIGAAVRKYFDQAKGLRNINSSA
jgi:hypothetical protein